MGEKTESQLGGALEHTSVLCVYSTGHKLDTIWSKPVHVLRTQTGPGSWLRLNPHLPE